MLVLEGPTPHLPPGAELHSVEIIRAVLAVARPGALLMLLIVLQGQPSARALV